MFAGLISIEQPVSAWGDPDKILAALAPYSLDTPRDVWAAERQLLVQVATRNGAESAALYRHPESGIAVVFWGRLDNRPDLIEQLEAGHKAFDDELIALAWLKWGEHCPEKLIGDFVFAVASPKTGVMFLARDVMGVKPLFYRADKEGVFFANSASAFKPLKLGSLTPSQEWMAKFLLEVSYSHTETAYLEIKKLPAAHSLLIHSDGRINLRRYHQFVDDAPVENKRNHHWLEQYQAVWREAVACRMPAEGPIGTENSGGLDSGSVTAEIARQLGEDIPRLYGFGFAFDTLEPQAIMAVAKHCRMANQFICSGPEALPAEGWAAREIRIAGYPNEHANGTSHSLFYEECRLHGIATLFSGFGGDEGVTLNALALRRELFHRHAWPALWDILPGALPSRVARFGLSVWRGFRPLPAGGGQSWTAPFIQPELMSECRALEAAIVTTHDPMRFNRVNEHALCRLSEPYLPTRLENATLMASASGVDYVWPLLDQRLLQQWLSTPSLWKVGPHGLTRYLHRRAIEIAGPPEMVWITGKDMGNAAALAYWQNQSQSALFRRMLALSARLPNELEGFVNAGALRKLAQDGLRSDKRDIELTYRMEPLISNLESLVSWLRMGRNA